MNLPSVNSNSSAPICTPYEQNALVLMGQKFKNNIIHKHSPDSTLRELYCERCEFIRSNIDEKLANYCFDTGGGSEMFLRYWVLLFDILSSTCGDTVMGDIISMRVDSLLLRHLKKCQKCGFHQDVRSVKMLVRGMRLEEKQVLLKCVRYFEQLDAEGVSGAAPSPGSRKPHPSHLPPVLSPNARIAPPYLPPQQPPHAKHMSPQRLETNPRRFRPRYGRVNSKGAAIVAPPAPPPKPRPMLPSLVRVVEYPQKR
mmetsp:Transcript_25793/g.43490  ORF Transcript_25793/g.43490 Transcript_25793/m.43490 type:complete len:255 (+) Transcript_25793:180-944(+)